MEKKYEDSAPDDPIIIQVKNFLTSIQNLTHLDNSTLFAFLEEENLLYQDFQEVFTSLPESFQSEMRDNILKYAKTIPDLSPSELDKTAAKMGMLVTLRCANPLIAGQADEVLTDIEELDQRLRTYYGLEAVDDVLPLWNTP